MLRKFAPALALALFVTVLSGTARADYIDHSGGHGPLTCSSPTTLKDYNQVEMWNDGSFNSCERWTGSINPTIGDLLFPTAGKQWVKKSPFGTTAYACMAVYHGNYGWCTDLREITTDWQNLGATPVYIEVSAAPPCPTDNASAFTVLHWAPGSYGDWTPMDGMGMATAVIGDGHVAPGLPDGNPLKVSDADVCVADLASYPNLHATGTVAAVYHF